MPTASHTIMSRQRKYKSPLGAILESIVPEQKKEQNTEQQQTTTRHPRPQHSRNTHARSTTRNTASSVHGRPHQSTHALKNPLLSNGSSSSRIEKKLPRMQANRGPSRPQHNSSKKQSVIPPIAPDVIRIIPLGGVEEVGKNMTLVEMGDDIVIIDAGFQFKNDETPGIDYIIPNVKYLEERKHKIRGMVITHGHMDHIGAIPYIMEKIGNPPIYTRQLTAIMINKRQTEFPHLAPIDMRIIEKEEKLRLGNMVVRFFAVSHSIPDSMGVVIETPWGNILGTGDLRVDNKAGVPTESEEKAFSELGKENNLLLMMDSTNATNPGFSLAESVVIENIEQIISSVSGRLIIGTFASQLQRIMNMLEIAERLGKKVAIEGRSMKTGVDIVTELGLLKLKKGTLIPTDEIDQYPDNKVLVIATGSQGEEFAAIMRISNKTHRFLKLKKGDTVLLSSSIIPGNEMGVQRVKDNLSRQGAKIIHYKISEIHASGHANADELLWIHRKLRSKFFMPIHGYHYMLTVHGDIARAAGTPDENIVIPDNGSIVEIYDNGQKIRVLAEKAPASIMMVDGFSVGDMQDVVIRDRQMLAQDGMFVVVAMIDPQTGKLKKSPDIISRGFVYLKESQELLHLARGLIKKTLEDASRNQNPVNAEYARNQVAETLSKFLYQKTAKRPLVIPVLLTV